MAKNKPFDPYGPDGFGVDPLPARQEKPPVFRDYPWVSLGVAGETEYTIRMSMPEFQHINPDAMQHKIIAWVLQALHEHHEKKLNTQREVSRLQCILHEAMSVGALPLDLHEKVHSDYWPERYRK